MSSIVIAIALAPAVAPLWATGVAIAIASVQLCPGRPGRDGPGHRPDVRGAAPPLPLLRHRLLEAAGRRIEPRGARVLELGLERLGKALVVFGHLRLPHRLVVGALA